MIVNDRVDFVEMSVMDRKVVATVVGIDSPIRLMNE